MDIEGLFEAVDVQIVNIDVWVTDKSGKPIEGLAEEDFRVFRDGNQVEIQNFYAVAGGRPNRPSLPPEETQSSSPDAASTSEEVVPEIAPEQRLWLIVYVDNYNIDTIERNRILPALRRFLGQSLHEGDRAMIVTYDRGLKIRHPFTDDRNRLFATLDELEGESGLASIRKRDQRETLERIDETDSPTQALIYARQYAEEQMNAVDYTLDALRRLIDSLGGLPGRKALVHVSSGIPMLAGEEMFHAVAEKFESSEPFAEIPRHDTTRRFTRVNQQASTHRVVFYTFDAGGLRGLEFGNAEYGGFVNTRLRRTLDSVVPENLQSPLRLMALETGGRAIVNRNEIHPALEEVAAGFRSFYSLGISATDAAAGRFHKIKVELREKNKEWQLRHRKGYRSKDIHTRMRESLSSALLYSHSTNNLDVEVQWGRPSPKGTEGLYVLPIQLKIPMKDLVLLPIGGDKHELRLRLFAGAVDEDSNPSEIDDIPVGLRLAEEHLAAARKESFVYTHQLLLSPGRKKVGIALMDIFSGQSSVVTRYVQVGPGD